VKRANIILAVLAAILAIPVAWNLWQESARFTVWADEPLLFEGLDVKDVAVIGFGTPVRGQGPVAPGAEVPRDEVWFQRGPQDQWVVVRPEAMAGAKVLSDRVLGSFFEFVQPIRMRAANVVVRDADEEQLEAYGLSRANAQVVKLQRADSTPLATLYVGRYAAESETDRGVGGYYVRDNRGTTVLFYERPLWSPTTDLSFWLDPVVHQLEAGEIKSLRYSGPRTGGNVVQFERDPTKPHLWLATAKPDNVGDLFQGEVTQMVQEFAYVTSERVVGRADENAVQDPVYGLSKPYISVEAIMEDGAVHRLFVGAQRPGSSDRFAVGGGGQWLVIVRPNTFDRFESDPAVTLFGPPR